MSAWMHKVLDYFDRKGKRSYPQPWWPLSKRLRFFSSPQKFRGLCDLPVELVLHIISFIQSDLDRLCFALSCKSLLELTDCWPLPAEWGVMTRSIPDYLNHRFYNWEKVGRDRWELLRRLENSRWRRCMGCYKLHPVKEFHKLDLWTPAWRRTCIFGTAVGIVRLCPCVEMTFRDKVRITKELIRQQQKQPPSQPGQPESDGEANRNRGLLPGLDPVTGQHECHYECNDSLHKGNRIRVQRKLKFSLDNDHNLILETEYNVTEMRSSPNDTKQSALLLCPHLQVLNSLIQVNILGGSSKTYIRSARGLILKDVDSFPGSYSCRWCEMTIFGVVKTVGVGALFPIYYTFKTRRSLGNAIENADNTWYRQTETSIENIDHSTRTTRLYFTGGVDNMLKYHKPSE